MAIARCLAPALGAAALLIALPSRADVPPAAPDTCTVDAQQKPGETCVKCPASFKRPDTCRDSYQAQGYAERCKSKGASVWHEVWCRASDQDAAVPVPAASASDRDAAAPAPAASASGEAPPGTATPPGKGGCGACAMGASDASALAWIGAAIGAFGVLSRRRRRAR
jgi:hypothetical protein